MARCDLGCTYNAAGLCIVCGGRAKRPPLSSAPNPFPLYDEIRKLQEQAKLLTDQNDRARNRMSHYAVALTKAWELLDDVCQSSPDQEMMFHHLPASVYDEAAVIRRSIGTLLQGEPWDSEIDALQELLAMRRELHEGDQHAGGSPPA